ncbi:MAG: hypothetical protein ACTSWN_12225 [Promethearchaeota archaeon]
MTTRRFKQLKFISSIFNFSIEEIRFTLGDEALSMIMRRVGERIGENIAQRIKATGIAEFCTKVVQDVFFPVIGENKASCTIEGNTIEFTINVCPYKQAGFKIKELGFFCHYTEGLIETAIKNKFPEEKFVIEPPKELISRDGCNKCVFVIKKE